MFTRWKQKRENQKAKSRAIADSQHWKNHPLLRECLQAMRGSCTVAPMELHEAAITVVNIALQENSWTAADSVPAAFLSGTVYLVWDNERLPVLRAPWEQVQENLTAVRAVSDQVFLVAESMDKSIRFDSNGRIWLYSVA